MKRIVKQNTKIHALKNPKKLDFLTVSWDWDRTNGDGRYIESKFLYESIKKIPKRYLSNVDIIICAGRTFKSTKSTRHYLTECSNLTGSTPILFEEKLNDDKERWNIVSSGGKLKTIRYEQLIVKIEDIKKKRKIKELCNRINGGEGVFRFINSPVLFQLLICGENNALKKTGILSRIAKETNWILINPSHDLYSRGYRTGYLNYNKIKTKKGEMHGNVIGRLVNRPVFRNGRKPPYAIIHTNNFSKNLKYSLNGTSIIYKNGKKKPVKPGKSLYYKMIGDNIIISRYRIPIS